MEGRGKWGWSGLMQKDVVRGESKGKGEAAGKEHMLPGEKGAEPHVNSQSWTENWAQQEQRG